MILRSLIKNHTFRNTVNGITGNFKDGVLPEESLGLWFMLKYNEVSAGTPDPEPHTSEPPSSFEFQSGSQDPGFHQNLL